MPPLIPPLPPRVLPGQLIAADYLNAIVDELARLRGTATTGEGTATVPNFFGLSIAQVRALMAQPTTQVTLGAVIDVTGAGVDILATANAGLIILTQNPQTGSLVSPGTPVNIVVSRAGSGGGTTTPPPPPTITRFESISGVAGSSFRVGDSFVIVGTNFLSTASLNIVTIGGVTANVTSDPGNPTQRLTVMLPTGIGGAPTTTGGPPLANVPVVVSLRGGTDQATLNITVQGPAATPAPQISTFTPNAFVGGTITITGTNFGASPTLNRVYMSGTAVSGSSPGTNPPPGTIQAAITAASATQITITVPNFGDLPLPSLSTKSSQITVQVLDNTSNVTGSAVSSGTVTVVRP